MKIFKRKRREIIILRDVFWVKWNSIFFNPWAVFIITFSRFQSRASNIVYSIYYKKQKSFELVLISFQFVVTRRIMVYSAIKLYCTVICRICYRSIVYHFSSRYQEPINCNSFFFSESSSFIKKKTTACVPVRLRNIFLIFRFHVLSKISKDGGGINDKPIRELPIRLESTRFFHNDRKRLRVNVSRKYNRCTVNCCGKNIIVPQYVY